MKFKSVLCLTNWTPWDRTIRVTCHSGCLNYLRKWVPVPQYTAHFTVCCTFCIAAPIPNIMTQCEIEKRSWISLLVQVLDSQPCEVSATPSLWSVSSDTEFTVSLCQETPRRTLEARSHTGNQPESMPNWNKWSIFEVKGRWTSVTGDTALTAPAAAAEPSDLPQPLTLGSVVRKPEPLISPESILGLRKVVGKGRNTTSSSGIILFLKRS